jgi:hypothetical protein
MYGESAVAGATRMKKTGNHEFCGQACEDLNGGSPLKIRQRAVGE